jgi:hypothetical protein
MCEKFIRFINYIWSIHIYNIYNFVLYFKLNIQKTTIDLLYFFDIMIVFIAD